MPTETPHWTTRATTCDQSPTAFHLPGHSSSGNIAAVNRSQSLTEILAALGEIRSFLEEQAASLQDGLDHAVEVMRENTEEVGVLRDAIDELRERYIWALNNSRQETPSVFHLTSLPADPCVPDWAARVNRVASVPVQIDPGGDVPGAAEEPTVRAAEPFRLADSFQAEQGRLF